MSNAMSNEIVFYHNPRCSKSREALALLEARGVHPRIIRYLDSPPTVDELRSLLKQLGLSPRELIRTREEAYKILNLKDPGLDDAILLKAMHEHPILIERPIAQGNGRAALGRPPENILNVLE